VTGFTKGHEIALLIAAAFGEWKDVVDFLCGCQLTLLLAFLAERVRLDVAVTDSFPASAVALIGLGVTLVLVVLFIHDLLMLGTVLLTCSEPTAAGVGTRTFWFIWHWFTSLGIRKALRDCFHKAYNILLPHYNTIIRNRYHVVSSGITMENCITSI
jgi:hypothetical protein